MDRASPSGGESRGFESLQPRQIAEFARAEVFLSGFGLIAIMTAMDANATTNMTTTKIARNLWPPGLCFLRALQPCFPDRMVASMDERDGMGVSPMRPTGILPVGSGFAE